MPEEYSEGEYGLGIYSGDLEPVVTLKLIDYFPDIIKRQNEDGTDSVFTRFIREHEISLRRTDASLDYIRRSRQIDNASGADLDKIGAMHGELGKRRGRTDGEYRTFLKGLVQSFNGRGTKPGLKFAVAAAVNTDIDNIVVNEDFQNNEYDLRIEDPDAGFLSGIVNEVAQLADPSGVELASPPIVTWEGDTVGVEETGTTVLSTTKGLDAGTLTMDGNSTLG